MKLHVASDLHGMVDLALLDPDHADVVVLAGDVAPLNSLDRTGIIAQCAWMRRSFLRFVEDHRETDFVVVPGNHDFWGEIREFIGLKWPSNLHFLINSGCEIGGVKFWGMPQIPEINGLWAFESRPEALEAACDKIPSGLDVLVTHTPPRVDGSDIDTSCGMIRINGKDPHFGSVELLDAILDVQPRYCFCGHIHTGSHECLEIGKTRCFNVSLLDEDYRIGYMKLEVEI